MKIRKFSSKQKADMVLDHIINRLSISAVCNKYSVSQSYFLKLKDKFIKNSQNVFEDFSAPVDSASLDAELQNTKIALAESQTALSVLKKKLGINR